MRVALEMAARGMASGGPPVGACLVRDGEVLVKGHNSVIGELDITAHAEIVVIREACRKLRLLDLSDCVLYVTVQPCSMCLSATYYAGIREIIYGASIADMQRVTGSEISVSPEQLFADTVNRPVLVGETLADECRALLASWREEAAL